MGTNSMWGQPARYSTDSLGNTVLVLADGSTIALSNQSITSMRMAATSTVGLATASVIPFDTVTVDDGGNYSGTPGKILIPSGTKRIRIMANVTIPYNSLNGGIYRQLKALMYWSSGSLPMGPLGVRLKNDPVVSGFTQAQDLHFDSGIFDVSDGGVYIEGAVGTNYIQLQIVHDSAGTNGGVANSVFIMIYSSINIEFYS